VPSPNPRSRLARALAGVLLAAAVPVAGAPPARAHDPSAWGGLFRSRDFGATWLPGTPGRIVSGALGLAVSPADANHLLLATDSGLLRSRNGGRDWEIEAPTVLVGPIFATAFDAEGRRILAVTGSTVFRGGDDRGWRPASSPKGVAPARALVRGTAPGRFYLAGWRGLYRTDDGGDTWVDRADGLPDEPATALAVEPGPPETLYAVVGGRIWARGDRGSWERRDGGIPPAPIDTVAVDPHQPRALWAAGDDRLFRSLDAGATWSPVGRPLAERNTRVRGIAGAGGAGPMVLTTDRGVFRSGDGGERWELLADALPAHLEAGPLVGDPLDPATLYAGFALIPYAELWRLGAGGGSALRRLDPWSLAGGLAFLVVLALGATLALRRLRPYYRASPP
jgi:photosystem II stability/assembly factor-like uncharacterized protein